MKRESMFSTALWVGVILAIYWVWEFAFSHAVLDTNWLVN